MMMIMIRGMLFVIFISKFHIEAGSYWFILDCFLRHFFVHVCQGSHVKTCLSTRFQSNLVDPKMDIGLAQMAIHSWMDT